MGTDLHAFVEFDDSDRDPFSDAEGIRAIARDALIIDRDYFAFDALAWGRSAQLDPEHRAPRPLVAPRGIPRALSLPVAWSYYSIVAAGAERPSPLFWPAHAVVSEDEAAEWEKRGSVRSEIAQTGTLGSSAPRTWALVSKPWWHTASWLLPSEVDASLAPLRNERRLPFTYDLLQAIVHASASEFGPERVRVVLWFDN